MSVQLGGLGSSTIRGARIAKGHQKGAVFLIERFMTLY